MPKIALPIGGGSYQSESRPVSMQRAINLYVSMPEAAALSQEILLGTPGISQLSTTGLVRQIARGSATFQDVYYQVNGNNLYRLNRLATDGVESFTVTNLGTIDGVGFVFMKANNTQMMILVPNGKGYILTTGPDR